MSASVRLAALEALSVVEKGRFASDAIDDLDKSRCLSARDKRFLTELVLGIERRRSTLDAFVRAYARMPFEQLSRRVHDVLRLALYQIVFLDGIPPHAAVSESVKFLRDRGQRGFVNGVLRTFLREMKKVPLAKDEGGTNPQRRLEVEGRSVCFFQRNVFFDPEKDIVRHLVETGSHPSFLVGRWIERFGVEEARALMERGNGRPTIYLRVNRRTIARETLRSRLEHQGVQTDLGKGDDELVLRSPVPSLLKSTAFKRGYVSVQGAFAQCAAPLLAPAPGELIVDIGSAPGGKAAHIAEKSDDRARILCLDIDLARLGLVACSAKRLSLKSLVCIAADATVLPLRTTLRADGVCLDVPCSNTAVLSSRPEARWRLDANTLSSLTELQAKLLESASSVVRPGGRLLYSTCSLEPEENELLVASFLEKHDEFTKVQDRLQVPSAEIADGGYLALLLRRE